MNIQEIKNYPIYGNFYQDKVLTGEEIPFQNKY